MMYGPDDEHAAISLQISSVASGARRNLAAHAKSISLVSECLFMTTLYAILGSCVIDQTNNT